MAEFETIATGLGFVEGPVWTDRGLFVTGLEHGCIYHVDGSGRTASVAETRGGPNGLLAGRNGLFVAQNGGIFAARSKASPGIQQIAEGRVEDLFPDMLEAPNDLCFGPDDRIYVTDPASEKGIFEPVEGRVLACDLTTGITEVLVTGRHFPNGLAFDAGGENLFLALTYPRQIEKFALRDGQLDSLGIFCELTNGRPDGMAIDGAGNLWICTPGTGGLEVFDRDGQFVRRIEFGQGSMTTNCCFGGSDMRDLYVTAAGTGSVLRLRAPHPGLQLRMGPAAVPPVTMPG